MFRSLLRINNKKALGHQTVMLLNSTEICCRLLATNRTTNFSQSAAREKSENGETGSRRRNPFAQSAPVTTEDKQEDLSQTKEHLDKQESYREPYDEERERQLKVLQLEVDIAYQEGRRVPQLDFFKDEHWQHVLSLPTKSARAKYYAYLWQVQMKIEARERKKVSRAETIAIRKEEERRSNEVNDHIIYGLSHTTMFLRIYESTMNLWFNNKLSRAMQFAPKIVLDCSYDRHMNRREALNAAKQLMLCFAENRMHDDPFDMHYCNVNLQSDCMQSLHRYIPTMLNPEFPMNVHEENFTELFHKESLVYLTPHCRNDLQTYNPDDIYIVGAMVDTVNNEPISLAKAKKLGLRMARLPLDRHLQWGAGSGKSLTLNQMINIMLDLKASGDWTKALRHVPRRKIINMAEQQMRQRGALVKRAERLNVRVNSLFDSDEEEYSPRKKVDSRKQNFRFDKESEKQKIAQRVNSRNENLRFNLETWGSKKGDPFK